MQLLDVPEGRLAIALGIGLVIGAERERRKGEGAHRRGAGIRTFAVVALLGAIAAQLASEVLLVAAAAFVGAIAVVAYWRRDSDDPGFTSEVTLVLTYCLGAFAQHEPRVALATGVSVAMLLALRTPLHRATTSLLSEDELRDALLFGVAAIVVLPLLPDRTIDRFGVLNPFTLWRLVVVLMALSGAGYIAQRALGPRYGLALAGLGGGFVSASATIAAMGAHARERPELLRPAVAGAAASSVATSIQLAILIGAASPALLATVAWPRAAGGVVAAGYAGAQTLRARGAAAEPTRGRAFRISTAVLFGALVTGIGFVATLARTQFGAAGAIAAASVSGFVDAHAASAAAASLSVTGQLGRDGAVLAILIALTTNTITKAVLAITAGPRGYGARVGAGLALMLVATWVAAAVTR